MKNKSTRRGFTQSCSLLHLREKVAEGRMRGNLTAFTLIELVIAVLIIGILAAVAVPMYQKAMLKSRYSTLMPIANNLAKSNEVYYLANGEYAEQESKLDVEGQVSVPEGTEIVLETDPEYLSYVRIANNAKVPNARYVVYQQHSANFAGTTMCETKDDAAKELCQSLGGVFVSDNGTESQWTSYLLSGQPGVEDAFTGGTGNEEENGQEETSTTMTAEELQAFASAKCFSGHTCEAILNNDGTISVCDLSWGGAIENGECTVVNTSGTYETIYDANGNKIKSYQCNIMGNEGCNYKQAYEYNSDTGRWKSWKVTVCSNGGAVSKEEQCDNYSDGWRNTYDDHNQQTSYAKCKTGQSSRSDGECEYDQMSIYVNKYDDNNKKSYIYKECTSISDNTCNNYVPTKSEQYTTNGNYTQVGCYKESWGSITSVNKDGSCGSGWRLAQYSSETGQYTNCTSYESINWETATCN